MGIRFIRSMIGGAVTAAAMATSAGAVSLTFSGFDHGYAWVDANPGPNAHAGVFTMTNNEDQSQFLAWCLDLYSYLSGTSNYTPRNGPFTGVNTGVNPNPFTGQSGNFDQAPTLTDVELANIENLFEVNANDLATLYSGVDSVMSGGFQLALWELIYEDSGSFSLSTGDFTANSSAAVIAQANTFLGNLGGQIEQNFELTFWQSESGTSQNLVSIAAVPLPAAGLLLLTGLAGMGVAARRRRKA